MSLSQGPMTMVDITITIPGSLSLHFSNVPSQSRTNSRLKGLLNCTLLCNVIICKAHSKLKPLSQTSRSIFRLRLSYEISYGKAKRRDPRKTWEWPKIDLRETWARKMKIHSSRRLDKLWLWQTDRQTDIATPRAPDGAKNKVWNWKGYFNIHWTKDLDMQMQF